MSVEPIPEGYHSVTPYLVVDGAERLIDFMKEAFGAEERFRMGGEDGSIRHAEVQVGDSVVMLSEANEEWSAAPTLLHLYVEDCDAVYRRALSAGAKVVQELANQFYGDRSGSVRDPVGNIWSISTHVEDVEPEELTRRLEAAGQAPA